ncbi:radical SAM protein [Lentibacter sp. XHP0401]|uniref:radical SAM protein n=1 Tax=Lentibacter sp. XHP0401 TaxID=2984334 RepID=UPI0021E6DB9B|nr:radical SAM protein [Lentibacter sp. XHP0401]MCV2892127.1 radical SAM protein [Lentibacter sp. XHP0401]
MEDFTTHANFGKFQDPRVTAKGETRASVALTHPETLWFNTGTLCNITCANCYIESSPTNDALVYLTRADIEPYLDEVKSLGWPIREIAFTGGEPFMNPEMIGMMEAALEQGFEVLVLTNAMRPMMRKPMQTGLLKLAEKYHDQMTFRISVDHWSAELHDAERGKDAFKRTIEGMIWLRDHGFKMAVAGRIAFHESEAEARAGYARLYSENNFRIDAQAPAQTVLFPEMDMNVEVPEITTDCWGILGKSPEDVMCSSSRMVVKRKGAEAPAVLACTLLAYTPEFELGNTLKEARRPVQLNHPHCAKFCVLGGASCSA